MIALTVSFEPVPRISAQDRIRGDKLGEGVWHMTVHFGFGFTIRSSAHALGRFRMTTNALVELVRRLEL